MIWPSEIVAATFVFILTCKRSMIYNYNSLSELTKTTTRSKPEVGFDDAGSRRRRPQYPLVESAVLSTPPVVLIHIHFPPQLLRMSFLSTIVCSHILRHVPIIPCCHYGVTPDRGGTQALNGYPLPNARVDWKQWTPKSRGSQLL